MGQYFKIVNPGKKQYIDASDFGENVKQSGILCGLHGLAVGQLICSENGQHPMFGSWAGDPLIAAGDYGIADQYGIATGSPENTLRNLYFMAEEEFENISHKAMAALCEYDETLLEEMVQKAKKDLDFLYDLSFVVYQVGCKSLEEAIIKEIGIAWTKELKSAVSYTGKEDHLRGRM